MYAGRRLVEAKSINKTNYRKRENRKNTGLDTPHVLIDRFKESVQVEARLKIITT